MSMNAAPAMQEVDWLLMSTSHFHKFKNQQLNILLRKTSMHAFIFVFMYLIVQF